MFFDRGLRVSSPMSQLEAASTNSWKTKSPPFDQLIPETLVVPVFRTSASLVLSAGTRTSLPSPLLNTMLLPSRVHSGAPSVVGPDVSRVIGPRGRFQMNRSLLTGSSTRTTTRVPSGDTAGSTYDQTGADSRSPVPARTT